MKNNEIKDSAQYLKTHLKEKELETFRKLNILKTLETLDLGSCAFLCGPYSPNPKLVGTSWNDLAHIRKELRRLMPTIRLKLTNYYEIDEVAELTYDDENDSRISALIKIKVTEIPESLVPEGCEIIEHTTRGYTSPSISYRAMSCGAKA